MVERGGRGMWRIDSKYIASFTQHAIGFELPYQVKCSRRIFLHKWRG